MSVNDVCVPNVKNNKKNVYLSSFIFNDLFQSENKKTNMKDQALEA